MADAHDDMADAHEDYNFFMNFDCSYIETFFNKCLIFKNDFKLHYSLYKTCQLNCISEMSSTKTPHWVVLYINQVKIKLFVRVVIN